MLWSDKRPQPLGEGAIPDRVWAALYRRLSETQAAEFEKQREALKSKLALALDKIDAEPAPESLIGHDARKVKLVQWCEQQELNAFNNWSARTKFDWRQWLDTNRTEAA